MSTTISQHLYTLFTSGGTPICPNYYTVTAAQGGATPAPTPYMVATVVAQMPLTTQNQPLQPLRTWHYQFSCFSPLYSQARTLANSLKAALVGLNEYTGITAAILLGDRELWEDDTKYYHVAVDIEIWENLT